MGSGMGPMAHGRADERQHRHGRRPQPDVHRRTRSRTTASRTTGPTLHLHGGITPWISDGTPHQWITPANETTPWPQGVSVQNVPDMTDGRPAASPVRRRRRLPDLLLHQPAERPADVLPRPLVGHHPAQRVRRRGRRLRAHRRRRAEAHRPTGSSPARPRSSRSIVQDRTFVPDDAQLAAQDPTWDKARWGGDGQPLVPPRVHARPEPRRPRRHERATGAGCTGRGSGRRPTPSTADPEPVLRQGSRGPDDVRGTDDDFDDLPRRATSTTRRRGSTRPTRSASRS